MKIIFAALVLAAGSLALADTASDLFAVQKSAHMDLNSVYGVWELGPIDGGDTSFTIRFKIGQNQMTTANKCTRGNLSALVAVTGPITITPTTITPTQNGSNTVTQNGIDCTIGVQAGDTQQYTVKNGVLQLSEAPIPANKISD